MDKPLCGHLGVSELSKNDSLQNIVFDLSDPNRSDFESQIASDCNRNSKKNHCDSKNTSNTAISLRFLREKFATSKL